ncbi:hypothetical protein TSUD_307240 [Trifolium subterraneum]|uniref:Uncharacterized protein n=1 Tax=Trifolium subterraneum TaxID=3900 RepID=A0A2Z6M454_TRISU|nr:hypothetical protein TSUD_307240 [Trifolium subterraneum]
MDKVSPAPQIVAEKQKVEGTKGLRSRREKLLFRRGKLLLSKDAVQKPYKGSHETLARHNEHVDKLLAKILERHKQAKEKQAKKKPAKKKPMKKKLFLVWVRIGQWRLRIKLKGDEFL